jgi:predicted RNA-binding protein with RPS1 domain
VKFCIEISHKHTKFVLNISYLLKIANKMKVQTLEVVSG